MTATPSSISSLTSEGSTSSIWLFTWRRSSAPDGLIVKLLNHGRDSLTSKSVATADHPLKVSPTLGSDAPASPVSPARARCPARARDRAGGQPRRILGPRLG